MKHIFVVFAIVFSINIYAQSSNSSSGTEINWISLEEAERMMDKEPRKVIVDVYTDWCGPCKMMNNTTFKDPKVVAYVNKNYYAIKFNAESKETIRFKGNEYRNDGYDPSRGSGRNSTHDLTKAIAPVQGRIAYPTIVYMDEEFKILAPVQGMWKADQFNEILRFFGEDAYLSQTWEEYTQNQN